MMIINVALVVIFVVVLYCVFSRQTNAWFRSGEIRAQPTT
jgi:hypothetical protein